MSRFIQKSARRVELPLGCKDLIDVEEVRNWKPFTHLDWPTPTSDRLAYIEGYLARLLQSGSSHKMVAISRFEDHGQVMVILDPDLPASVVFASWHNVAREQALRGAFDEARVPPVTEPVGRWKSKRSLNYLLPREPSVAARLVCEVLRVCYGLGDLSVVNLSAHEPKFAQQAATRRQQ